MSEEARKTIALINKGELPALSNSAEVAGGEFGLQPRYDSGSFMKIENYFETIRMGKRRLGTIIVETLVIIGLIIALLFLSNARNNAEQRAEAMQAAVEEHEAFESVLQTENRKVRVSAMAAATQLKNHSENMAEMQGILENQMKDIDRLVAERATLMSEIEGLRAQIGENAYKDIKLTDTERTTLRWVLALECKGEPEAGRKGCLEEIFNRALRRDWKGNTVGEILAAPGQFKGYEYYENYLSGKLKLKDLYAYPDESEDEIIDYVLTHGRTILPEDYVYFATSKVNGRDFIQIGRHYFSRG